MAALSRTAIYQKLRFIARAVKYARRVDPSEIRFMRRVLRPGDLAIDIGAHKGGYVYWFQRAVSPSGKVLVFEPQERLAAYLARMKDLFGFEHVEVICSAVSNGTGRLPLFHPGHRVSTGATLVPDLFPENDAVDRVDAVTLDDFFERRTDLPSPRYIKIDVETHELEVIEGGRRLLERARPVVQFEADQHVYGDRPIRRLFDLLTSIGFDGFFFFDRRLRPIETFDLAIHQPAEWKDRPNHPGFANNFIFLDRGREARLLRRYGIGPGGPADA